MSKDPVAAAFPCRGGRVAIRAGLALALLAAVSGIAAEAAAAPVAKPVKDLTRSAEYIFRGTVQKTGAANLSIVESDARTAVVRVDEVLKMSGTLDDFAGQEVTVFLNEALQAGDQRVFFTQVRLLGESLGVQEVGRAAGSVADLKAQVGSAESELLRDSLSARLAGADLAVSGRVLSLRATEAAPQNGPVTEHDPQWWEAVIEINSVLKGQVTGKTVAIWYPGSADVLWAAVPKPRVGQEGTWLLHRTVPEGGAAVFAVADAQDLLSAGEAKVAAGMVRP
ncbi:MAG TPA: hypothetical protein VF173_30070 [Thermoanaerobaculia bacterium]|nr:hypothetical protein [Thermoanaerobaculia bacterium]